jgi:hypothetical protein
MKKYLILFLLLLVPSLYSQELYIMSHPAANLAKNRVELRNNLMGYDDFQYFHNSLEVNYGILGNLTAYNTIFYTTNSNYKLLGNYDLAFRYRFYQQDKQNYHLRAAWQTGANIPLNPTRIENGSGTVTYELHPGHTVTFIDYGNSNSNAFQVTVPVTDFHSSDNITYRNDLITTLLINKFAATAEMGWNINIPENDFKFGDYFDWTLAFGYNVFPKEYSGYNDVNINLYMENKAYYFFKNKYKDEVLPNSGGFRLDTFLGLQTIFFSSVMAEFSYKIPVHSNEYSVDVQGIKRANAFLFSLRYLFKI